MILSFNCMECIAASRRPSDEFSGFTLEMEFVYIGL